MFLREICAQVVRSDVAAKIAYTLTGCEQNELGIYNRIDFNARKFSRCDSKGCDTYDAIISRSGEFLVIDIPGRGVFAKLRTDGSQFVEVTSLGTSILASFGECRRSNYETIGVFGGRDRAEAGATPHQIAAVTGHKTLSEIERYTREAAQPALAALAPHKIG